MSAVSALKNILSGEEYRRTLFAKGKLLERFEGQLHSLLIHYLQSIGLTHSRFYELAEIYLYRTDEEFHSQVTKMDQESPVMSADKRLGLKAFQTIFHFADIPNYFPYVEEYGDAIPEKDQKFYDLIKRMNDGFDEFIKAMSKKTDEICQADLDPLLETIGGIFFRDVKNLVNLDETELLFAIRKAAIDAMSEATAEPSGELKKQEHGAEEDTGEGDKVTRLDSYRPNKK